MRIIKRLIQLLLIGLILISFSCERKREKDIDEIVLSEIVYEENGIYYVSDCELHSKKRFSGDCKFYHNNAQLKGSVHITNGLPDGHWEYWDSSGLKTIDMYYNEGILTNKEKHTFKK
ncbi:MAG: hypothetical protein JXR53_06285 [Bacteroidales bacterium]|nr:hypothetical protein [Bacteroidales bacterium]